jgi:hypothetical protein
MKRSLFLRVLLSLLLLVSQQMAVSHAVSHLAGVADQTAQAKAGSKHSPTKELAGEAGCSQCFAYAQMASVLSSPTVVLPVLDARAFHQIVPVGAADCLRTVCVFRSRAPPLA